MFKHFRWSLFICVLGALFAFWRGETTAGSSGLTFLLAFSVISLMEVSLSFDNAVINARKLQLMDPIWQKRFLTWGIAIAVFGMRFVFPIVIVAIFSHTSCMNVLNMALNSPDEYAMHLEEANVGISSFGACFLFMLFFEYMIYEDKEFYWIKFLERPLHKLSRVKFLHAIFTLLLLMTIQGFLTFEESIISITSGLAGIAIHIGIHTVSAKLNTLAGRQNAFALKHAGLMGFVYLEFIDASFSLDGVLGAFALTKDVVIIAIGLGVGAFFVRSLTIVLVQYQTLTKLRYLTNGAYWAISTLATIMLISAIEEVPEVVTGITGTLFIVASFIYSIKANKLSAPKTE